MGQKTKQRREESNDLYGGGHEWGDMLKNLSNNEVNQSETDSPFDMKNMKLTLPGGNLSL